MKLNEINIRDPFILPYGGKYYMYGSRGFEAIGFDVYISEDLEHWSSPGPVFEYFDGFWGTKEFWAPEVHVYNGKFYMFASFNSETTTRGTQVLVADSPTGPFLEHSREAITPKEDECLDGTLYIDEKGTPYIIYCQEWIQIDDGAVCVAELSKDLKTRVSEPRVLWKGSASCKEGEYFQPGKYITDGPFMIKAENELLCLWSTMIHDTYKEVISRSDNGEIDGNWRVDENFLYANDGGHGMIFKTFNGDYKFTYHCPNIQGEEHPCIKDIRMEELVNNHRYQKERLL